MFARDEYLTMKMPSIMQVLIYTSAMGGLAIFWTDFTIKTLEMLQRLANEMFEVRR